MADGEVLRFRSDLALRRRFLPHGSLIDPPFPAKMAIPLLMELVRRYTVPGDVILDPFGGCGTTMLAALEGRHACLLELESGWVEVCRRNAAHLAAEAAASFMPPLGEIVIRQGDSRYDLAANSASSHLPPFADLICTSPPFFSDIGRPNRRHGVEHYLDRMHVNGTIRAQHDGYDAVLTSQPYHDSVGGDHGADPHPERMEGSGRSLQAVRNGYSADAVITSQPYADRYSSADPARDQADDPTAGQRGRIHRPYSTNQTNIGNLRRYGQVDRVITSPPYAAAVGGNGNGSIGRGVRAALEAEGHRSALAIDSGYATAPDEPDRKASRKAARARGQVGEFSGQTYLDAMRLVWQGCFAALRPGGVLVAVVGNVVRDGREIRLDDDTIRLLEAAGFRHRETLVHQKRQVSFFRRMLAKKYEGMPLIDKEYVIVADRPADGA